MKKIFILLLVLMVLCLTSCSLGERMLGGFFKSVNSSRNPLSGDDSGLANARFEQILNACANRDEGAMKALFSQRAIEEAVDIDKSITALFDFFQGGVVSYDDWGALGTDEGINDDGTGRIWKSLQSTYDVETSSQKYRFAIKAFYVDTADPDNVGIHSLYVVKAEDSDLQFAYWGDGKWTPGITME